MEAKKKKKNIAVIVVAAIGGIIFTIAIWGIIIATFIGSIGNSINDSLGSTGSLNSYQSIGSSSFGDHINVIYVEGEIGSYASSMFEGVSYDHQWTLGQIDYLMSDGSNKGIMLYVNSPGGGVYESDELYLKLMEYKEVTQRPVYAYMAQTAASGGYYICMAADKVYANRMTMTGSIGVIMSTMDTTELQEKIGIKTENIVSGKNKAMGNPLTGEQKAILQEMIDETYGIFVGIVAQGRNLPEERVRELADGRVYSALQAKEAGLIDEVGLYEEAIEDMKTSYALEGASVSDVVREKTYFEKLFSTLSKNLTLSNEFATIQKYLEGQKDNRLMYKLSK